MRIVIELTGQDATEATLRAITQSPDCCLGDGELAIRARITGIVEEGHPGFLDPDQVERVYITPLEGK